MSTENREELVHSADVQMHLSVNGHVLRIGHLGPDYVILDDPIDHPPADAEISLCVDGSESHWQVKLVDGQAGRGRLHRAGRTPEPTALAAGWDVER